MGEFREVHGDKYKYPDFDVPVQKKIEIVCPSHGSFMQDPFLHKKGTGCKKCATTAAIDKLVGRIQKAHGSFYKFDENKLISLVAPIDVICPHHGQFSTTCRSLAAGVKCPRCRTGRLTYENWVARFRETHQGRYEYPFFDSVGASRKSISIICPDHGEFIQNAFKHLRGHGCPACGLLNSGPEKVTRDEWIARFHERHGEAYNYDAFEPINALTKATITCPVHGNFEQKPSEHEKYGCARCGSIRGKTSAKEIAYLDRLGIVERQYVICDDIGVMYADGYDPITNTVYEFDGDYWHGNPARYHPADMSYIGKSFGELYEKHLRKSDRLLALGYNLIRIWESDYDAQIKAEEQVAEQALPAYA